MARPNGQTYFYSLSLTVTSINNRLYRSCVDVVADIDSLLELPSFLLQMWINISYNISFDKVGCQSTKLSAKKIFFNLFLQKKKKKNKKTKKKPFYRLYNRPDEPLQSSGVFVKMDLTLIAISSIWCKPIGV